MNCHPQKLSILLITQDAKLQTALRQEFAESVDKISTTDNLATAAEILDSEHISLVVCPWILVDNNLQLDAFVEQTTTRSIPVVFHSDNQTAAVKFHQFLDRSFYCLQTSACVELVSVIHDLASRLCPPVGCRPPAARPRIGLPVEMTGNISANIHSMY